MGTIFSNLIGTLASFFRIGNSGIKDQTDYITIRDSADTENIGLKAEYLEVDPNGTDQGVIYLNGVTYALVRKNLLGSIGFGFDNVGRYVVTFNNPTNDWAMSVSDSDGKVTFYEGLRWQTTPLPSIGQGLATSNISGDLEWVDLFASIGSSTDNAIIRWDGTTGDTPQDSGIIIDDANNVSGATSVSTAALSVDGNTIHPEISQILDGLTNQQQDISITVSGGVVYLELQATGGGDIEYIFGEETYTLDCTTGPGTGGRARVALTQGTATSPQINYVYVTESGGTLTLNASTSLPTGAIAWTSSVTIQSDTEVAADGPLHIQRTDDALKRDGRGVISLEREKLRALGAEYLTGVDQTLTITPNGGGLDSVVLTLATGAVYQLHRQTWPAYDISTDGIWVANASGSGTLTNYQKLTDLNSCLELEDGTAITNNQRYVLTVWGAMNSIGETKVFVNLPNVVYSSDNDAIKDVENSAVTIVPPNARGVAFLIGKLVLKYTTASSGTIENVLGGTTIQSLLGVPIGYNVGGGGGGGGDIALPDLTDVSSTAQTANFVLATPDGVTGNYLGRALVADDIPSLLLSKISDAGLLADNDTVGTTDIDNDAVTLDKIATGTANYVIGYDGSGNPTDINPSTFSGVSDHGALTGLTDDDHTQYPLLSENTVAPSTAPSREGSLWYDTTGGGVYFAQNTTSVSDWLLLNSATIGSYASIIESASTGTEGGSATATTWNQRSFVEEFDDDNVLTVSSNKFTLAEGRWRVFIRAQGFELGGHRIRIYNDTQSSVLCYGDSVYNNASGYNSNLAVLSYVFDSNGTDEYIIEHYSQYAQTNNGLGQDVNTGADEIFMKGEFFELIDVSEANATPTICVIGDIKANGTNGGDSLAATWMHRDVNTVVSGADYVSISTNTFVLDSGTWLVEARAPAFGTGDTILSLYNNTQASREITGDVGNSLVGYLERVHLTGEIVSNGVDSLQFEQYTNFARTNGLGTRMNKGEDEVYLIAKFTRVG